MTFQGYRISNGKFDYGYLIRVQMIYIFFLNYGL